MLASYHNLSKELRSEVDFLVFFESKINWFLASTRKFSHNSYMDAGGRRGDDLLYLISETVCLCEQIYY